MTQPTDNSYKEQMDEQELQQTRHHRNTTSATEDTISPPKSRSRVTARKKLDQKMCNDAPAMRYHEWYSQGHTPPVVHVEQGVSLGGSRPDCYCDGTSTITFFVNGIPQPQSNPRKNFNVFDKTKTFTDPKNIDWNVGIVPVHPVHPSTSTSAIEGRKQQQHSNEVVNQ